MSGVIPVVNSLRFEAQVTPAVTISGKGSVPYLGRNLIQILQCFFLMVRCTEKLTLRDLGQKSRFTEVEHSRRHKRFAFTVPVVELEVFSGRAFCAAPSQNFQPAPPVFVEALAHVI